MSYLSKIMRVVNFLLIALGAAFLLEIDGAALRAADAVYPGSGRWVCLVLVLAELLALIWLYRALFVRQAKLVLQSDATEEERQRFLAEMRRRLSRNRHVRAAGLKDDSPDFLEEAMKVLDARADEEIRSCGRKVFLGTALAQNGRLDALIVFFSLCRMVWRVSAVYNQRPSPREIWSVYATVSSATFVAFSIEALDIPQTIADTMSEIVPSVAPAMAASSVPLLGSAMHVFTTCVIDGAANCLLAVRAGVITRRAYRYSMYGGEESLRRSCVREAGSILMDISQESVGAIGKALKKEIQALSLNGGKRLVDNAGRMTECVTSTVAGAASSVARAAADTANTVGNGAQTVADCGKATAGAVFSGVQKVTSAVKDGADTLGGKARDVGNDVKNGLGRMGSALGDAGSGTISHIRGKGRSLWRVLSGRGGKA